MNSQPPFRIFFSNCEIVTRQVRKNLMAAGLQVVQSFDLQSACASFTDDLCPHHGTAPCDCQLVVFLVFGLGATPVSLIFHGHRGQTEVQWDDAPGARPTLEQQAIINEAMNGAGLLLYIDENAYADVA